MVLALFNGETIYEDKVIKTAGAVEYVGVEVGARQIVEQVQEQSNSQSGPVSFSRFLGLT